MTIFLIMIAYVIGIIWGLYIKNIALLFFLIPIYFLIKHNKFISNKKILLVITVFLISLTYVLILENSFRNKYKNIKDQVKIEAVVVSNIKEKQYKNICTIKVDKINDSESYKGTCLQLSIKNKKQKIEYGDSIIFTAKYQEASTARNNGGFDYKEYLKINKIYGLVTTTKIEKIEHGKYSNFLITINSFRNKIIDNANTVLEKDEASLLTGILIGNKDNLSKDIQENFRNSSLSHLLAVSGAHVSYVILGISTLLNKSKFPKKVSKIVLIIFLFLFMILTGATSSVTRACIMAIYVIIGGLIYRKPNILASISISLLIILIINPYKILDVGLQLSYGGTAGIIAFSKLIENELAYLKRKIYKNKTKKEMEFKNKVTKYIYKTINSIKQMIIVSISANLIIFPVIAYHYNTFSLTFFISNILAGPLLGIIIILGFITVLISFLSIKISNVLAFILSIFLKILIKITDICSNLPFSKIYVKTPSILFIVIYYSLLIALKKQKIRINKLFNKKAIALILIVILIFQLIKIIPTNLKIYFIDVEQGDSTLVVTPMHKTILIDGGGSLDSENYNVGKSVLIPYLLDRGITKLDYIFISHFDTDHVRSEY